MSSCCVSCFWSVQGPVLVGYIIPLEWPWACAQDLSLAPASFPYSIVQIVDGREKWKEPTRVKDKKESLHKSRYERSRARDCFHQFNHGLKVGSVLQARPSSTRVKKTPTPLLREAVPITCIERRGVSSASFLFCNAPHSMNRIICSESSASLAVLV